MNEDLILSGFDKYQINPKIIDRCLYNYPESVLPIKVKPDRNQNEKVVYLF
jgi:hypothetical protein